MYAAPFEDGYNNYKGSDNNYINNKKKQIHNKTQKREIKEIFDQQKVNNVLQKIHNSTDDEDTLGDFNPPPKPESVGVSKTNATENMQTMNSDKMLKKLEDNNVPSPLYNDESDLELNNYNNNYGDSEMIEEYYEKMIPMYQNQNQNKNKNLHNRQYYNNYTQPQVNYSNNKFLESNSNDILIQKLNYMINLLEEQQDEKTNNVTEEVVLYSFLGIFIIFVVDSFARAGKYKR